MPILSHLVSKTDLFTLLGMSGPKSESKNTSLAGKMLLAMPGLGDQRFHRAVILLCAHSEAGAMGLVVNHQLPGLEFTEFLKQLKLISDIQVDVNGLALPVFCGGPVEGARGFLLHSNDFTQPDTIKIDKDFSVTGTIEALKTIVKGNGPQDMLFILGYAGWGAGQLEQELQDNAWLVTDAHQDVIFHPVPDEKWERATRKMGIDPALLSSTAGHA